MVTKSMEDYLEAALLIEQNQGRIRITDIARFLGVRMPSVTGMVKTLVERGYMEHDRYGDVHLTDKGRETAEKVLARHKVLKEFLVEVLGVDEEVAEKTACGMEHAMGQEVSERFSLFVEFVRICPRCGQDFLKDFLRYSKGGTIDPERCRKCINDLEKSI